MQSTRKHFAVVIASALVLSGALFVRAGTDNGGGNNNVNNGNGNGNGNGKTICTGNTPSGSYSVIIAGHWSGKGQATISGSSVGLVSPVTDANGKSRTLNISNLVIEPNNHFAGNGDIDGSPVSITGRLEPKAPDGNGNVKGWRILATFHDGSGTFGAVVGAKITPSSTTSTVASASPS